MGSRKTSSLRDEHYHLLKVLKQTAEWLLCCNISNVWNTYGGLSRFSSILDEILSHGLRCKSDEKYWPVVRDFYKEEINVSELLADAQCYSENSLKTRKSKHFFHRVWLEKSLLEHNLSQKLCRLTEDVHHVYLHYEETAFLRNAICTASLLVCVQAVEQNQPMLLMDLDPFLIPVPLDLRRNSKQPRTRKEILQATSSSNKVRGLLTSSSHIHPIKTPSEYNRRSEIPAATSESDRENNFVFADVLYKSPSSSRRTRRHRSGTKLSGAQDHKRSVSHPIHNGIFSMISTENDVKCPDVVSVQCFSDNIESQKHDDELCCPISRLPSSKRSASCPDLHKIKHSPDINNAITFDNFKSFLKERQLSIPKTVVTTETCKPAYVMSCDSVCDSVYGSYSNVEDSISHAKADASDSAASLSSVTLAGDCDEVVRKVKPHSRSKSESISFLPVRTQDECDGSSYDPNLYTSLPNVLCEQEQQKTKSIFEGSDITVPTECFFPRPEPGQTLTSFLSTDLNIRAELDRENAHFCISEALISAIEQVKCSKTLKFVEEETESDEEIKKLTQRIRIRRREKLQERATKTNALLSDGKTDTTTSHSASPMSTSHSSEFGTAESIGSDEDSVEDLELSESTKSNLGSVRESGLSLSMASMYSDADLIKANINAVQPVSVMEEKRLDFDLMNSVHLSAEAVALSLIKRFSEKQLPKASELEWLVSEQDAPQRILPLPDSWPVSPEDDDDYDLKKTRLRGNLEWAPPRRQIIFMIHPKPRRKDAIVKQNYRCAGCGMKITQNYVKKFRYCEYLGKFFCQCCHANDLSYIPGWIIWKWDFRKFYVSKFAFDLLDQMHSDPLFNIEALNSNLYRKSRQLDLCREYRQQMFYLRCFLKTCRNSEQIKKELECLPEHILSEPHTYSINDLLQVRYGELTKVIGNLVSRCVGHVMKCILCQGKGFICEICNNDKDIIFPFQLAKVSHCKVCGSCFHKKCFKTGPCPKCIRIQERKKLQQQQRIQFSDDDGS